MNFSEITVRINASLSFRLKRGFRETISWIYQKRLAGHEQINSPPSKPLSNLRLLFFTGQKQMEMLQHSARSVEQNWTTLPRLLLVSDGSVSTDDLRLAFSWWQNALTVQTWQDFATTASAQGRTGLAKLAEQNMLGRKLCAILESALEGETLFSDTDILWFQGPPPLPASPSSGAQIKLAEDLKPMYEANLLTKMGDQHLEQGPWLNTGVCFVSGDVFAAARLDRLVEVAAKSPAYFSEQTILSWACKQLRGESWPLSVIHLDDGPEIRWPSASFIGQGWTARHYTGYLRHWFWVDAYFLQAERIRKETTS